METPAMKHSCAECHEPLTMHADGTVACSCAAFADPDNYSEMIPNGWDITREEIYALQLAESDYQDVDVPEVSQ